MKGMPHVLEPGMEEFFNIEYRLKGKWASEFFKNNRPIILELGCGKGEYTNELARAYPESNFIGIDIKGARMWRGAKTALEENINNAAFLRTRIEWLGSFFAKDEISQIWITFPDPQLKERRAKKRLTGTFFLNTYKEILKPGGKVHLKTDSWELYDYTRKILGYNSSEIIEDYSDVYSLENIEPILTVKTHYEKIFLKEGKKITYLQFGLDKKILYAEPLLYDVPDEERGEELF